MAWLKPVPKQADGFYESAIDEYTQTLESLKDGSLELTEEAAGYFSQLACQAFSAIQDWEGMEAFVAATKVPFLLARPIFFALCVV